MAHTIISGTALFISLALASSAQAAPTPLGPSEDGTSSNPPATKYADVKAFLQSLVARYPQNARLFELGASDSGQMIQGIAIGTGSVHNLVVASHHGNEYGSVEVARAFAQSVAAAPIAGQTIYVVPVLNLAGYDKKQRQESASGRSWDPNRNYSGPCGTEGPFTLKSTQALAAFVERESIVTSATLHTFYPAVVYPWGMSTRDLSTPYDDLFKSLVQAATQESHYEVGNSTEVIYPADGTYEDYAFWKHGIWSLLFELGPSHTPSNAQIRQMVQVNVPGLRRFMEQAPRQRADNHAFTGRCDTTRALKALDRHDE